VGLELSADYPYTGKRGSCVAEKDLIMTQLSSFIDVAPNSVQALKEAVAIEPVSVAIEAD